MASLALSERSDCPSASPSPAGDEQPRLDVGAFVRHGADGRDALELMVTGARCAACLRKIEGGLLSLPGVAEARLNLSTQRLRVTWTPGSLAPESIPEALRALGYGASLFNPEAAGRAADEEGRRLLRYLAVAGFAAMNIMMFSVPIWSGRDEMGEGTRTLLHWISALIAIPAALYAAQPFFRSAYAALKVRRANMDVPISLAVFLTLGMSIAETLQRGEHAYFDGITMLLFFLLIGRYLDHQLRERARTAARELLALQAVTAARIGPGGATTIIGAREVEVGNRLLLAPGERAPVDGIIEAGISDLDCSMLTGETAPVTARAGDTIHAGAINLTQALALRATARAEDSALADLARLIEAGEQGRARFVRLADRAASLYVPLVHTLAGLTFVGWFIGPIVLRALGVEADDVGLRVALQNAVAVLIITCPCALGLAVPAVQIVATGRLFKSGVLVKSGDALERLAEVDVVVFDKTGTLTLGKPRLASAIAPDILAHAATLARASRHPLSKALAAAAGPGAGADNVREFPGDGLEGIVNGRSCRLGRRSFAAPGAPDAADDAGELWFTYGNAPPVRFAFSDTLRADAALVVEALRRRGCIIELLSGDRPAAVAAVAAAAKIERWRANVGPVDKIAHIEALRAQGKRPLMVGDGLNDAAALAVAHASASPGAAIAASQAAADLVIQGARLAPLVEALDVARSARARSLENLGFSAFYNVIAAPLAAAGLLTPLIAALAMSGSSLIVTLNALRLQLRGGRPWTS